MKKRLFSRIAPLLYPLVKFYWWVFRPETAGAKVIVYRDGKVLWVKHVVPNIWSFPGGGMERREEPVLAAVRELCEEVGLDLDTQRLQLLGSFSNQAQYKRDTVFVFSVELTAGEEPTLVGDVEIEQLAWFAVDNPPAHGPVTARMLKLFLDTV